MPSAAIALKYLVKVFGDLAISKFFVICAKLTINNGLCAYFIIESYHSLEANNNRAAKIVPAQKENPVEGEISEDEYHSHNPKVPGSTPGYPKCDE